MQAQAPSDLSVVVTAKRLQSPTVVSIEMAACDGSALPAWSPGAHIDVSCGPEIARQYSLCGDPKDLHTWRIAVLREEESRGGSVFLHDVLNVGDKLHVRGPRNNFTLVEADRYLFIAGGIGITPLLPMIAEVDAAGRSWSLLYGGRSRSSMAFLGELARFGDRVEVRPQDEYGLLDIPGALATADEGLAIYCCGPAPLIAAVEGAVPDALADQLRVERFAGDAVTLTSDECGFEVVLRQSGMVLQVPPTRTVLDVLLDAGIDVESSCEEGVCGTCEVPVLSGRIDHRDLILTRTERERGDVMFVCVSRCLEERLELDI